jgi:hypothetical protein
VVDEPKVSYVRRVLIVPVAMVVWILVADPSFLGLNSRLLRQFVSSEFGIDLGIRGHQQ